MLSTLSNKPANENITIHHTKTKGLTFCVSQLPLLSATHLVLIASISLFCCSYISCCSLIFSCVGILALPISAIASFGDVTPFRTFPSVGLTIPAAPNRSLPTVLSANFSLVYSLLINLYSSFAL